jgi:predicted nucleic acid-binding protein
MVTSDVIAITKGILNEYKSRAYTSKIILQAFFQALEAKDKLKFFNRSYIESRINRYHRTVNYPVHKRDKKWINVAIAIKATYIISTNSHLLDISPIKINEKFVETVLPSQYTEIRCPSS